MCEECSAKFDFSTYTPLSVQPCPECGTLEFIPHKIKDFWLIKPLGGGGMGSVYKALTESGKFLAVKVLPREQLDNSDLVDSLYREGKIGQSLGSHPNIVEVVDFGLDGDEYFLATEFVDGERLDIIIDEEEKLSEEKAIDIALQILNAESHIYHCGYLFRDLKPQNVIIEHDGTARLFDYGLCVSLEEAANPDDESDSLEGSPYFIPPERIMGAPEGEYSEIYSLGMLIFYMLSGRNYYNVAKTTVELVGKHVTATRIASVATRFSHCQSETVRMIDKMITRYPQDRYCTFYELKADMEKLPALIRDSEKRDMLQETLALRKVHSPYRTKSVNSPWKKIILLLMLVGFMCYVAFGTDDYSSQIRLCLYDLYLQIQNLINK